MHHLAVLAESPPDRTGRRRSVPGNSSDKTTPTAMEATSAATTPFRVTVSTVSRPFTGRVPPNRLVLQLSSRPSLADESLLGSRWTRANLKLISIKCQSGRLWCLASAYHTSSHLRFFHTSHLGPPLTALLDFLLLRKDFSALPVVPACSERQTGRRSF